MPSDDPRPDLYKANSESLEMDASGLDPREDPVREPEPLRPGTTFTATVETTDEHGNAGLLGFSGS